MNELERINQGIRDAEWNRDGQHMGEILADELIFRRANGLYDNKETYLKNLKDLNNTYDYLENLAIDIKINEAGTQAIATVMVKGSGKRGPEKKLFSGIYRNIRFFQKIDVWKLYSWYNEPTSSILHIPAGHFSWEPRTDHICGTGNTNDSDDSPKSPYMRSAYVEFKNGAYTEWHSHDGCQLLIVTEGVGFVEERGNKAFDINKDDRIYIQPGVWHRHGAKEGQRMIHLAVTDGETHWENSESVK